MDLVTLAHLVAAAGYAGFQWTVRVLVYPQLGAVGRRDPEGFPAHAARHQQLVSRLVGPLFLALVVTAVALVASRPGQPLALACLGSVLVVLVATALGAVPQHRVLATGWDAGAHARLLRWDDVRVVAASTGAVCAVLLVLAR